MTGIAGRSVVVVGGSRGLGLGVSKAASHAGAHVTVVSRSAVTGFAHERGDATDEAFADKVLFAHRPDLLVITAGAIPVMRPLNEHTWATFSANWQADVRIAFGWLRAALRLPLAAGSRVIVFGSGAELRGSPLSGGYAGAKATVRLITSYAAADARDLGITMTTVLPVVTPGTVIGNAAIRAYGNSAGPSPLTPRSAGDRIVELATAPTLAGAYVLSGEGLTPLAK
ncbi:SDR family oxidoreductase [Actinoplanes sp. KI2]|uniref:SDR family oxidoreductase n=1 Tax=Actinoplanes sp. KI2 TaxID=2983315 RepID=UPI0021D5CBD3|nr:SDR family oxidoreductase [Actinoplanes sp. KI2]MCU7727598.1 SDR family oxidoreductase [Actinoplanes sp. KI2]